MFFFIQVSPTIPAAIYHITHVNTCPLISSPLFGSPSHILWGLQTTHLLIKNSEPTDTQSCRYILEIKIHLLIGASLCESTHRVCMRRLLRDHCVPLVFIVRTGQLEFYPGSPEKTEANDFETTTMADLTGLALTLAVVAQGECQNGRYSWPVTKVFRLKYLDTNCSCVLCVRVNVIVISCVLSGYWCA